MQLVDNTEGESASAAKTGNKQAQQAPFCGVVRPIANMDGYQEGHWLEVHQVLAEAATDAGYIARLVSDDEALGVILGRIVTNLHDDPVVIVDVSGLNPNVLFELGMRLAFDRPVIVIKDDVTRYPFDASPIEYLPYPADLRHAPLMTFKHKLIDKIKATVAAVEKPGYRSFLKHFGSYRPGELGEGEALSASLIMNELSSLRSLINKQSSFMAPPNSASSTARRYPHVSGTTSNSIYFEIVITVSGMEGNVLSFIADVEEHAGVIEVDVSLHRGKYKIMVKLNIQSDISGFKANIAKMASVYGVQASIRP